MNKKPIIVIDDDDEDLEFMLSAFSEMKIQNEIIVFNDGLKFLEYMRATKTGTFFILCDIQIFKMSGIELKKIIYDDEELRLRCVPFIFMSGSGDTRMFMKAYSYGVQGYFIKPDCVEKLKGVLQTMVAYWSLSQHPNI